MAIEGDLYAAITALADASGSPSGFIGSSFRTIAERLGAPYASVRINLGAQVIEDHWHAGEGDPEFWRGAVEGALTEAVSFSEPRARLHGGSSTTTRIAVLAAPVRLHGRDVGGVAMAVGCRGGAEAHARLSQLRALIGLVGALVPRAGQRGATDGSSQLSAETDAMARASSMRNLHELAFAIVNGLRAKVGCEQLALGLVHGGHVSVTAVSGLDWVVARSPGIVAMRGAMEECVDARAPIICNGRDDASEHRLHRSWHDAANDAAVATVPLFDGDRVVAVLGLRHRPGGRFEPDFVERVATIMAPYGPALQLVRRATRSVIRHTRDSVRLGLRRVLDPRSPGRALVALGMFCAALWLAFGTLPLRVSAGAAIAPSVVRHLTAPFDGRVLEVHALPGDDVAAGAVVCVLDTADLELEVEGLRAELEGHRLDADRARLDGDQTAVHVAEARGTSIAARIELLEQRIAASRITAPTAGTLIEGDLRMLLGDTVAVGTTLVRLAPRDELVLELEIPETEVPHVDAAMAGEFATNARPDLGESFRITRLRPGTELRDGRNVLVAEASIRGGHEWARPGMQGVARIDAGEGPAWWVLVRGTVDKVRLWLWI